MTINQHPDDELLKAYSQQPEADEFKQVSLHLLNCRECREQIELSQKLKHDYRILQSEQCSEGQQSVVDDFLYNENSPAQHERLKLSIRKDPQLLKSALFSLSHRARDRQAVVDQDPLLAQSPSSGNWMETISEWFRWQTSTWATVSLTAVVTLTLTIMMIQPQGIAPNDIEGVSIASYQDNNSIRFLSRNQLPGIGFFNAARQSTRPFENMQIKSKDNQTLEMTWKPVELATSYELSLFKISGGKKILLETFKAATTRADYSLAAEDYNQRFEWVLTGFTSDDQTFITEGGFVVQKTVKVEQ